jgi:hypothetical protein
VSETKAFNRDAANGAGTVNANDHHAIALGAPGGPSAHLPIGIGWAYLKQGGCREETPPRVPTPLETAREKDEASAVALSRSGFTARGSLHSYARASLTQ